MYFNDKSDTNIDNELKEYGDNKKLLFNFDFDKYKMPLIIAGILLVLIIVIIIIFATKNKYYIVLNGESEITMYQGDTYIDPGYYAYDKKRNNLTSSVVVEDDINMNKVGEYIITYSLKNVKKTRIVSVVEKVDGVTYIHLNGDTTIYLNIGDTYREPGYVVVDTVDKNLSDKVKIDSNVDTSKEGVYRIIYMVVNLSGVTTSAARTVIVSDK